MVLITPLIKQVKTMKTVFEAFLMWWMFCYLSHLYVEEGFVLPGEVINPYNDTNPYNNTCEAII